MDRNDSLNLKPAEIQSAFNDPRWAEAFPPVLTVDQAAALLQIPKNTLYAWSSRGMLKGCARRAGKRLLFFRDRILTKTFNDGVHPND